MTSKAAVVTGGAQGLGAAVCRGLAARGWTVAVADINAAGAATLALECERTADAHFQSPSISPPQRARRR